MRVHVCLCVCVCLFTVGLLCALRPFLVGSWAGLYIIFNNLAGQEGFFLSKIGIYSKYILSIYSVCKLSMHESYSHLFKESKFLLKL